MWTAPNKKKKITLYAVWLSLCQMYPSPISVMGNENWFALRREWQRSGKWRVDYFGHERRGKAMTKRPIRNALRRLMVVAQTGHCAKVCDQKIAQTGYCATVCIHKLSFPRPWPRDLRETPFDNYSKWHKQATVTQPVIRNSKSLSATVCDKKMV